jgi:hypothetical protein
MQSSKIRLNVFEPSVVKKSLANRVLEPLIQCYLYHPTDEPVCQLTGGCDILIFKAENMCTVEFEEADMDCMCSNGK